MAQENVAIVTDSTAFLPEELVEKHSIHVIPLNLHWGEESMLDGVDITPAEFYRRLETASQLPTTSQPSAGRFLTFFQEVLETADSIVAILISSELSGTVASAHAAVEMMDGDAPVAVVDSRSASLGLGLIALAAARAAERGAGHQEVAALAQTLVPHVHVYFVVDTLEYLHKGGRIGGAKRLLGSVLSIKPVLHLTEGHIEPLTSVRTKRKALDRMVAMVQEEADGADKLHMGVIDAAAPDEGDRLAERVRTTFDPVESLRAALSPVIGTHVGPGTLGIGFYDGAVLAEFAADLD